MMANNYAFGRIMKTRTRANNYAPMPLVLPDELMEQYKKELEPLGNPVEVCKI